MRKWERAAPVWRCCIAVVLILSGASPGHAGNCGVDALVAVAPLLGRSITTSAVEQALGTDAGAPSPLQLRGACQALGLPLSVVQVSLPELRQKGCVGVLHLQDPPHYVTLAAMGSRQALVHDGGVLSAVEGEALAKRFSGTALIPTPGLSGEAGIRVDEPFRLVLFSGTNGFRTETMRISNAGRTPVDLEIAGTACSCTGVALSAKRIAPGSSALLSVPLRPRAWGTTLESITLRTSDPVAPMLTCGFLIDLSKAAVAQPDRLGLNAVEGQRRQGTLTLYLPQGATITGCSTRHDFIEVKVAEQTPIPAGVAHRVEVSVLETAPAGAFADEIRFGLAGMGVPEVTVPLDGQVEPDVAAHPQYVFLGTVVPGTTVRRTVVIQSASGKPVTLKRLQCNDRRISTRAVCGRAALRQEVALAVRASGRTGEVIRDRVTVSLADGRTVIFEVFAMLDDGSIRGDQP